ncbi:MAG: OmpH family outer membrane protein [Chlamydiae bacterium]|nr:OmpH family outer membrane protein [Chlamydiota bacterium]MBI3277548.1 OmpH family outer membrane protein [Chlamydiota bacterium]
MKKMAMWAAVLLLGCAGVSQGELKIAYVDVEKVFNEYDVTKQNDAKLKEEGKGKTQERTGMVDEIKKLKDEAELLSEGARKEKEAAIEEKLKTLREFDEKTKGELKNKRDYLLKKIFDDIRVTIEEIGKSEKYDLIFNDRALLYKTASFDITDKVTQAMNEKAKKEPASSEKSSEEKAKVEAKEKKK